jgi:hypothetical protein
MFVVACAEIPRALRLCRKLDSRAGQEQAEKAAKSTPPKEQKQPRYQLVIRWLRMQSAANQSPHQIPC